MSTKNSTTSTTRTPEQALHELAQAFTKMLHEEADGLTRFNEIELELSTTQLGTPEHKMLKKERTEMILQVRNSRKAQEAIKYQMLKI